MTSLILRLLTIVHSVYSQCTGGHTSYCLKTPSLEDANDWVSTEYIYWSTMWGCEGFISTITGQLMAYWSGSSSYWLTDLPGSNYNEIHCHKPLLDDCGPSDWVYEYADRSWPNLANLYIEPCDYLNQCSNSINGAFCITNSGIFQGEYHYAGCSMERPYYESPHFILSWNAIFLLWIVSQTRSGLIHVGNAAYCDRNELQDCNGNWYVWDEIQLQYINQNVTSGSCDNVHCGGTDYDICIVRGVSENAMISILWSDLIGRYANSNSCNPWNTNLMDQEYSIQYYQPDDAYYVVYRNSQYRDPPRCLGHNITRCYESGNQWEVYYEDDRDIREYRNAPELIVTDCSDIYNQCYIDYDLALNVFDTATDFAGTFGFDGCDENGYPVFNQYQDINGNKSNYSVISFDVQNRAFEIYRKYDQYIYASCNSLSLDYCQGFWYPKSINFTLTHIATTTFNPTTSIPTTSIPTTSNPTTFNPTTSIPTTSIPITSEPTTFSVTTTQLTTASDSTPVNPMQHPSIRQSDANSAPVSDDIETYVDNKKNVYIILIVVGVSILSCLFCLFGIKLVVKCYKQKHMETINTMVSPSNNTTDAPRAVQGSDDERAIGNKCKAEDCSTETDEDMYIVNEVPEITSGAQVVAIDNEMPKGVKVGGIERKNRLVVYPTGGINGMCTDCKQMKKGKVYDGNYLFYCFECWKSYDPEISDDDDENEDMYDSVEGDHETTTGGTSRR